MHIINLICTAFAVGSANEDISYQKVYAFKKSNSIQTINTTEVKFKRNHFYFFQYHYKPSIVQVWSFHSDRHSVIIYSLLKPCKFYKVGFFSLFGDWLCLPYFCCNWCSCRYFFVAGAAFGVAGAAFGVAGAAVVAFGVAGAAVVVLLFSGSKTIA